MEYSRVKISLLEEKIVINDPTSGINSDWHLLFMKMASQFIVYELFRCERKTVNYLLSLTTFKPLGS